MVRHELTQGSITIGYGWDHVTGYFLSVADKRIHWSKDAPAEAKTVAQNIEIKCGGGGYFDIHTGFLAGWGDRVKKETMMYFWKKFGVPDNHVQEALNGSMED